MSGSRRENTNNRQQQSSWIKTGLTFVVGAAAGALVAGAAYMAATEEDREAEKRRQILQQQLQREQLQRAPVVRRSSSHDSLEEKVDGVIKCCEICFVHFDELKTQEIKILSTPCGHLFCEVCINEALARQPRCPHCRTHVESNKLRRLYL